MNAFRRSYSLTQATFPRSQSSLHVAAIFCLPTAAPAIASDEDPRPDWAGGPRTTIVPTSRSTGAAWSISSVAWRFPLPPTAITGKLTLTPPLLYSNVADRNIRGYGGGAHSQRLRRAPCVLRTLIHSSDPQHRRKSPARRSRSNSGLDRYCRLERGRPPRHFAILLDKKKRGYPLKKPAVLLGIALAAVVLGVLVYSSLGLRQYRVEVCIEFQGRQACRTASGATREAARRTATDNACALISNGMTESIACSNTPPSKITWHDGASD